MATLLASLLPLKVVMVLAVRRCFDQRPAMIGKHVVSCHSYCAALVGHFKFLGASELLKSILTTLRWSFSIGNKFFRVVPRATLTIVIATLVSQFSILLAFLLPLKVIILLGSTGIPRYFPSSFANFDRDLLVITLSSIAIGFYLLYFLAEKVIAYGSNRGADLLLRRSQKMALFENQEEVASRGYQRYSRSLASSIFLFLVAAGLSWLYPELLLILVGYIVTAFLLLALLYSSEGKVKVGLDETPGQIVNTATSIGFLLAFGFMVTQFLLGDPPGLLIAIISLILMRQGFSRVTGLVNDLKGLYSQRFKLNALFFHGHVLVNETKKHETNFWALLQSPHREQWVLEVLRNASAQPVEKVKIQWYQLGIPDIAVLRVKGLNQEEALHGEYLIKLFNVNKSSQAKHEATLLSGDTKLQALPLLSVDEVQGLHCHVMQWYPAKMLSLKKLKTAKHDVTVFLMAVEPEKMLVSRFSRSRPPLWQRIDHKMLDRLGTVAEMLGSEHIRQFEQFFARRDDIMKRLQRMPLTIVNPDLGLDVVLKSVNDELLLIHWGRWSLEPVGAGWPVQPKQFGYLSEALVVAKEKRKALQGVSEQDIRLAALVFSLEKQYSRQRFVPALKLIPGILECLEKEADSASKVPV